MFLLVWSFTDILALLLTDTLIFLQEKDQKYTFATVVSPENEPHKYIDDSRPDCKNKTKN